MYSTISRHLKKEKENKNESPLQDVMYRELDGKCILVLMKNEGIAFLSVHNIYSYDIEKLIKNLNNNHSHLLPHPLADRFWNTTLVSYAAYKHLLDEIPENRKVFLNPKGYLMEFRMYYRNGI